jgi:undecaprenyl-diphosphatase
VRSTLSLSSESWREARRRRRRIQNRWLLALASALFCWGLTLFSLIAEDVWERETFPLDQVILNYLFSIRSSLLTTLAQVITFTGSEIYMIAVIPILAVLGWRKYRADVNAMLLATSIAGISNLLLKVLFARPRPTLHLALELAPGYSFPSGHGMIAVALYGMLGYLIGRRVRRRLVRYLVYAVTVVWILLVGLTRNYLGVHSPSDILAAYAITLPILLGAIYYHLGAVQRDA